MEAKKSLVLIVVGAVAALLLLGAGLLLVRGILRLSDAEQELDSSWLKLAAYFDQDPFPSQNNVTVERANQETLETWYDRLMGKLTQGQTNAWRLTPATFINMLLLTEKDRLIGVAEKNRCNLRADFAFGFDRYASGNMPYPEDVERLSRQLFVITKTCDVIFTNGATALISIKRERFEADEEETDERRGRKKVRSSLLNPNAGKVEEGKQYSKLRFVFDIKATDAALARILNALADHDLFFMVPSVKISKDGPDVILPAGEAPGGEEGEEATASPGGRSLEYRENRVVSGPGVEKPMNVQLTIDACHFTEAEDE